MAELMLDQIVKVKQSVRPILYLRDLIASLLKSTAKNVSACFRLGMSLAKGWS